MADPTAAQRRMFAKMGLAMPDGSFYIRNGSVGASDLDNAIRAVGRGESDGTSGDTIRKHIMKRATALKLSDKIPDSWNSDGSLKQDGFDSIEAFLEHYGVQGMHWRSTAERQAAEATATTQGQKGVQAAKAANAKKKADPHQLHLLHLAHLLKMSKDLAAAHAKNVAHLSKTGQKSKIPAAVALHQTQQAAIGKVAALAQHSPGAMHCAFDEEFIAHFGVKGMHWGVRTRSRGAATASQHSSPDAARARATMDTISKHGVHSVSTADLQHLVSRQSLEKQHASLNPVHVSAGRKAAQDILLQVGKQQAAALANKAVSEGIKKLTESKS